MIDLKSLNSALEQLEEEKNLPRETILDAIEEALGAAYKKDYGKKGQIIRAKFDTETGGITFSQIKIVMDESMLKPELEEGEEEIVEELKEGEEPKIRFNPEHHIMVDEAQKIKKKVKPGEELIFPLEMKDDYGRIAAQTAKQVIVQKIREAERSSIYDEFKEREGEVISGIVQRIENNNNVFVDLGRATSILPKDEQIQGERYRTGERIKALLYLVEQGARGVNLYLSRMNPKFVIKLFEIEVPEIANGIVEVKSIAREAGSRTKMAVFSNESDVDPVGSCVGQKGTRVTTVISELAGEKIDIIEWSEDQSEFIASAISPAKVVDIELNEPSREASVVVEEDQLSLAIGKSGQNVRLAAKLTGWKIDIVSRGGESVAEANEETGEENEEIVEDETKKEETKTKKKKSKKVETKE
jgi:N utilization substance protein A